MSFLARVLDALRQRREANALPVVAPPAPPQLVPTALLRQLGAAEPEAWAPILSAACARHEITTPLRLAAFLANVLHETGGLKRLVESLDYSAERLCEVWPGRFATVEAAQAFAHNPELLAAKVYGARLGNRDAGDGWRFRGRGLIQLTGRGNYAAFAMAIGAPVETLPALLETREGAAESAAHYWRVRGCNPVADKGDIRTVRIMVNGGTIGLGDVEDRYRAAAAALGVSAG